jgi:phage gpG-like protein
MSKPLHELPDDMARDLQALEEIIRHLPDTIGAMAVRDARRNFRRQGFDGSKWKARKGSVRNGGRAILIDRGVLRDSIRYWHKGNERIEVGVDQTKVPYAKIHNEGGRIKVTDKMRAYFWAMHRRSRDPFFKALALTKKSDLDIPKRQFLGMTKALDEEIEQEIEAQVFNVFGK